MKPVAHRIFDGDHGVCMYRTAWPTRKYLLGARGRVDSSVVLAGAATYKTRFTYDALHRVRSSADPAGHTQFFGYDARHAAPSSTGTPLISAGISSDKPSTMEGGRAG